MPNILESNKLPSLLRPAAKVYFWMEFSFFHLYFVINWCGGGNESKFVRYKNCHLVDVVRAVLMFMILFSLVRTCVYKYTSIGVLLAKRFECTQRESHSKIRYKVILNGVCCFFFIPLLAFCSNECKHNLIIVLVRCYFVFAFEERLSLTFVQWVHTSLRLRHSRTFIYITLEIHFSKTAQMKWDPDANDLNRKIYTKTGVRKQQTKNKCELQIQWRDLATMQLTKRECSAKKKKKSTTQQYHQRQWQRQQRPRRKQQEREKSEKYKRE